MYVACYSMLFLASIIAFIVVPAVVTKILLGLFWTGFLATVAYLLWILIVDPMATAHWPLQGLTWYWYPVAPFIGGFATVFITGILVGFAK